MSSILSRWELFIAVRYLTAKNGFVSFIAMFSLIGMALGVATLIVVMSVMNGFHTSIAGKMIGWGGDINISSYEGEFNKYDKIIDRIKDIKYIKSAYPIVDAQVMIIKGDIYQGGLVKAMRYNDVKSKAIIRDNIVVGSLDNFKEDNILIGSDLADILKAKIGDQINLISPKGTSSIIGFIPRMKHFTITGIFKSGMYQYDSSSIIMPWEIAGVYFKMNGAASSIEVEIDDPYNSYGVVKEIQNTLGIDYRVDDWQMTNATYFNVLKTERVVMFVILMLIIIIAAFNIVSTLRILVTDKKKDIAVLINMGASKPSIVSIFVLCGSLIGITGITLGLTMGLSFALNIEKIRKFLESITGNNIFDPVVYYLSALPSQVDGKQVATISIMTLVISIAASIYPAYVAARVNPAEGLRYD